jgi:hypothetical protein
MWHFDGDGVWKAGKTIAILAEPAASGLLPEPLKQLSATPPVVADIALTLDDRTPSPP